MRGKQKLLGDRNHEATEVVSKEKLERKTN